MPETRNTHREQFICLHRFLTVLDSPSQRQNVDSKAEHAHERLDQEIRNAILCIEFTEAVSDSKLRFRPNVAAILRRRDGRILVCERSDVRGAWQFPQGGVNPGETHEQALVRELEEEISLKPGLYHIVECKGPYRYVIGNGKTKKGFHGQEQLYFLLDFLGDDSDIDVHVVDQEFSRVCWIAPESFKLSWLPPMKREVYTAVFENFFGVRLKAAFRD